MGKSLIESVSLIIPPAPNKSNEDGLDKAVLPHYQKSRTAKAGLFTSVLPESSLSYGFRQLVS